MIVVGLIVAAFQQNIGFEVNKATDLLALSGSLAIFALSAWLIVLIHGTGHEPQRARLNQDTDLVPLRVPTEISDQRFLYSSRNNR